MNTKNTKYDLGKLSIAFLEHLVEPALGKQFIEEAQKPLAKAELEEALSIVLMRTEQNFIKQYGEHPVAQNLLSLSIADIPTIKNAIFTFYKQPNNSELAILLESFLVRDLPKTDPVEIQKGVADFIYLLRLELSNVNSEIREKLITQALLDLSMRLSVLPLGPEKRDVTHKQDSLPPLPDFNTFVGREDDILALKTRMGIFGIKSQHKLTVMRGWPGIGKTTLSTILAYQNDIRSYFKDGIFWCSVGDIPDLMALMPTAQIWGASLNISEIIQNCRNIDEAFNHIRQAFSTRKSLLIIDDVYELPQGNLFRSIVGENCIALFTTRFPDIAKSIASNPGEDIYVLSKLSDENSLKLLQLLASESVAQFPEESRILVKELEGLPLAIQVAGRMLYADKNAGLNVASLLKELQETTILMNEPAPANRIGLASETNLTIAALFRKSTDRLSDQNRFLFALLGAFVSKPATFDVGAMTALWGKYVVNPAPVIRELINRGLLEYDQNTSRYQMHSLLTMHAKQLFESE